VHTILVFMSKPKTHTRLTITLPIDMAKELRKPCYGKISRYISKSVTEKMQRQMRNRFVKEVRK